MTELEAWKRMAQQNADTVMALDAMCELLKGENDALRASITHGDREVEQFLQTIEHLESEVALLSDHISALELENTGLRQLLALDEDANGYRVGG